MKHHGTSVKGIITVAVIAVIAVAIVLRIGATKKLVAPTLA